MVTAYMTCICGKCVKPRTIELDPDTFKDLKFDVNVKPMSNQELDKYFEGQDYE